MCVYIRCVWIWILRLFRDLSKERGDHAKKPRREERGDVTLMASGIIKIINIYHKKRRRSGAIRNALVLRHREGNRKWRGNFQLVKSLKKKKKSSARAARDCATGHKGESPSYTYYRYENKSRSTYIRTRSYIAELEIVILSKRVFMIVGLYAWPFFSVTLIFIEQRSNNSRVPRKLFFF